MKVGMRFWHGPVPCPEWFKEELVEMTEDEFFAKVRELVEFKYEVKTEWRKNNVMIKQTDEGYLLAVTYGSFGQR